jgi:hypothetical protein
LLLSGSGEHLIRCLTKNEIMPDNARDKSLNNPTKTNSKKASEKINPITETEPVIPRQAIEKMDIHHRAHHEGKKNWKSYIWEFLMLFLAVFCGFLAQNLLEHRLERERGDQYVRSMIEDIISDSAKINQSYEFGKKQELALDSLSKLFDDPPYNDTTIKRMYVLMLRYTMNVADVAFTKRTVSQLKNSGGMRLIANKESADEITKYIEEAEDIESQGNYFRNIALPEMVKLNNQIFYLKYIKGVTRKNVDSFMTGVPVRLANNNENLLAEYSNQLYFASGLLINYNNKLTSFKSKISKIVETLREQNNID